MMADPAARMFDMSASVMSVYWLETSASACAVKVTLRLAATPCEVSTLPRKSVIITGRSRANSTADTPRYSPTKRAIVLARAVFSLPMACPLRRCIGFVLEDGGGSEEIIAAGQVTQIKAEQIDVDRILVIDPQHHDIARSARVVAER